MKQYKEQYKEKIHYLKDTIYSFLPKEDGYQRSIMEAVNYSMMAGGKHLRSLFMLESYLIFSEHDNYAGQLQSKKILECFLAAMEMIHTYSLVHDDLPSMDDDMYRRGKLTTHAKFGEALGVLAGDALLNLAFETAIEAFNMIEQDKPETLILCKRISGALMVLSRKAGIYGMIGGQTIDVVKSGQASDLLELKFIYQLKTSALLEASFMIGAILGGADEKTIEELQNIAGKIGMAFQIQDDILDVTGDTSVLGKSVHNDEKNNKTTYITICGLEAAAKEVTHLSRCAAEQLDDLLIEYESRQEKEFLRTLILELIYREK